MLSKTIRKLLKDKKDLDKAKSLYDEAYIKWLDEQLRFAETLNKHHGVDNEDKH